MPAWRRRFWTDRTTAAGRALAVIARLRADDGKLLKPVDAYGIITSNVPLDGKKKYTERTHSGAEFHDLFTHSAGGSGKIDR